MKKAEIQHKFDEIVAFAEIEKFIETPVKRYSSGMYVRLAFAVAAHLEPEILLVDEVLAVGDAAFQKKCLGKMGDVARGGRTVLFVSHNMAAIQRLCPRAILLDGGRLTEDDAVYRVVPRYLGAGSGQKLERTWNDTSAAPGDRVARLRAVRVRPQDSEAVGEVDIRSPIQIDVEYFLLNPAICTHAILIFNNDDGIELFTVAALDPVHHSTKRNAIVKVKSTCHVPGNCFAEGRIWVTARVSSWNPNVEHLNEDDVVSFLIVDRSDGDGVRGEYANRWPGVVRPMLPWTTEVDDTA